MTIPSKGELVRIIRIDNELGGTGHDDDLLLYNVGQVQRIGCLASHDPVVDVSCPDGIIRPFRPNELKLVTPEELAVHERMLIALDT